MRGMSNPKNDANITDLQRLAEITKRMTERKISRAVNEAPVPEMEDYEQLHDNTRRQTRSMSARKPSTPTVGPAPIVACPRVQPQAPIPAQNAIESPPQRVDVAPAPRVQKTAALRVQETAVPRVQETAVPRVQERVALSVQDTSKSKRPRQKKKAPAPIASRTRSQQKSGPTSPAYSTRSQMRGTTALALALAAATDCAGIDCSPQRLTSRRFPPAFSNCDVSNGRQNG